MTDYLRYILTVIGIGYFITQSSLFKPVRERISLLNKVSKKIKIIAWFMDKLDGVINCIYCASFWIGIFVFYLMYWTINSWTFFYAFSCMGAIYVIKNIFTKD